jgi:NAD-dependent dihydropyrimidine dehydrogenase PreA subunit
MKEHPRILFCNCAYSDVVPGNVRAEVLDGLSNSGVRFDPVSDLCGLAAEGAESLRALTGASDLRIAACYPRAVRWIFHSARADLPTQGVKILNMRTLTGEQVLASLLEGAEESDRAVSIERERLVANSERWVPWFPVIDYDRCTDCRKCLDFCLFGVFALSGEQKVEVRNPRKCKTNCPACARICPQAAIVFPKHPSSPINGDEVKQEDLDRPEMQVDVDSLISGDVYSKLRGRTEPPSGTSPDPEVTEKVSDLARMKDTLGIPDEVLDSLGAPCCCDGTRICESGGEECTDEQCDCGPCGENCGPKDT